jgi:hypothetical protein
MSSAREPPASPGAPPSAALLARLLRLVLSAERSEEFVGDLIEEAALRARAGSRASLALWLWSQTLRSIPSLVVGRLRALVSAVLGQLGRGRPGDGLGGVLVGARAGRRGWPLSVAVSLSAHAAVAVFALLWVVSRVDEIEPPRIPLDFAPALAAEPSPATSLPPPMSEDPVHPRRLRAPRRTAVHLSAIAPAAFDTGFLSALAAPVVGSPPPDAATPPPTPSADLRPSLGPVPGGSRADAPVRLPPRVVEKRCLSCPLPQLPHPHAVLALGREMMVKTCVSARGDVTSVNVLRGFDRAVDARVTEAIRGWRLSPYSLEGHPVPFCYATRFVFASH